jgi:hypothetical protein
MAPAGGAARAREAIPGWAAAAQGSAPAPAIAMPQAFAAAAAAAAAAPGGALPPAAAAADEAAECSICFDAPIKAIAYPCGHQTTCSACARKIVNKDIRECSYCATVVEFYHLMDEAISIPVPAGPA